MARLHQLPITIHPSPSAPTRLDWLDLFRGAAVVLMIETHIANTFLAAPQRATAVFWWMNYFNGLVAPAFLFIAGYAQGLGMRRAGEAPGAWGKKASRLFVVWLLGYALHFPAPQLLAGKWDEAFWLWQQVDVLPCLAVSLALLLAIGHWVPRGVDAGAVALFAFAVFLETPAASWQFPPTALLAYFNHSTGSLFPLLPWLGFACAGFLCTAPLPAGAWIAALLGLAWLVPGGSRFFFHRLAWLVAAVPLAMGVAKIWRPRWLLFAGCESLPIYALHLVLIETLVTLGIPRAAHGFARCAALFAAVVAVVFGMVWLWRRWKTRRR